MKRSDQDRLLREILGDAALERVREAALSQGITALRRRRQRRALLTGGCTSLLLAVALAVVVVRRAPPESIAPVTISPPTSTVKILSDAELLALFPDRPLALFGRPGEQQLVFLDRAMEERPPR